MKYLQTSLFWLNWTLCQILKFYKYSLKVRVHKQHGIMAGHNNVTCHKLQAAYVPSHLLTTKNRNFFFNRTMFNNSWWPFVWTLYSYVTPVFSIFKTDFQISRLILRHLLKMKILLQFQMFWLKFLILKFRIFNLIFYTN